MMISKLTRAACAALALVAAGPAVQAKGAFVCEMDPLFEPGERANYDKITGGSQAMERVVIEYRKRWDAVYVRNACERVAAGKPADMSCLNGRRDWTAIKAMIPHDLFGMSKKALRPYYLQLQAENDGYRDAVKYCRAVGAF